VLLSWVMVSVKAAVAVKVRLDLGFIFCL